MGQRIDAVIFSGGKFYDRYELRADARSRCPAPAMKRRRPMVAKVRKIDGNPRHFAVLRAGAHGLRSYLGTASPLFVEASLRQLIEASKLPDQGVGTTTSTAFLKIESY
jgi:hypothetical protein